ncbi:unnamed protein product [Leptosia nina]|uniref:Uncharacterized protein n=1 Tax=Leptosia nina TaxID=320188 RepID=A0AAV1JUI8_9NEOP
MQCGPTTVTRKFPVVLGKIFLRWVFNKADLVFFIYRIVWYALYTRSSMNSSVDFFESLIDEDGRFSELNCQEPQRVQRQRPSVQRMRPHPQGK